nr:zinc ribbon domain-containing protein [uncultured Butyrivibrio sp.]
MGLFDSRTHNQQMKANDVASSAISNADSNIADVEIAVKDAFLVLGEQYFEANKNNQDAEYYAQVEKIKELKDKKDLWQQYKLSLEGKAICENCNSVISSDSAYCNRCGSAIKPRDFSVLGIAAAQSSSSVISRTCPQCGSRLVEGAMFCEKCGQKL